MKRYIDFEALKAALNALPDPHAETMGRWEMFMDPLPDKEAYEVGDGMNINMMLTTSQTYRQKVRDPEIRALLPVIRPETPTYVCEFQEKIAEAVRATASRITGIPMEQIRVVFAP
jgi:hypothetical protein